MCLGAPPGCLHFHAGSNTWKVNKSFQREVQEALSSPWMTVWGSPGKSRENSCPGSPDQQEGECRLQSNPSGDPLSATHPGPGQTLERAELTCRVTWSTLSADGSRMLTMPRSVSTRI